MSAVEVAKAAQPAPYDWTGCYVGGNVGYSTVNSTSTVNTTATSVGPITVPTVIGPIATQASTPALNTTVNIAPISTPVSVGPLAIPTKVGPIAAPVSVGPLNLPINIAPIATAVSVGPLKVAALQGPGAGSNSGAIAGAQFGCNFIQTPNQGDFGSLVFGLEGDFELAVPPKQVGSQLTTAGQIDFGLPATGLIKGRIGITPLDRLLVYAVAGGGVSAAAVVPTTLNGNLTLVTQQDVKLAPVVAVGVGIEAALSRHWTTKAEFLYVNAFPVTDTFNFLGAPATVKINLQNSIFHAGLNYRF